MELGPDAVRGAWARLLHVAALERTRVLVDADSPLCRAGWIGILSLDGTVTATVPDRGLQEPVAAALGALHPGDAVRPELVRPRLPAHRSVLGPVPLFYPPATYVPAGVGRVELVSRRDLDALAGTLPGEDVEESGVLEGAGPAFGSRTPAGELAAVCRYRRWPNGVAHLAVVTGPAWRRQGYARTASLAAMRHALDAGLLPQWRARPPASQGLARSLGLVELGAQLNVEPA